MIDRNDLASQRATTHLNAFNSGSAPDAAVSRGPDPGIVAAGREIQHRTAERLASQRGERADYTKGRFFGLFSGEPVVVDDRAAKELDIDEHRIPLEDLLDRLGVNVETGLSHEQVLAIRARTGLNKFTPPPQTPEWVKFGRTQTAFFSLLLWVASVLCFVAFGLNKDQEFLVLGVVLAAVVICTGLFSYYQERKSDELMNSFKNMLPSNATVLRAGREESIPTEELVVGDIVLLKYGIKIPADIRVLEASDDLKIEKSALNGEPEPVKRTPHCTDDSPLETRNLCFLGCLVPSGTGVGVVYAVGDDTYIGKIAGLKVPKGKSPIKKEIEHFVRIIGVIAVVLGVTFFAIGLGVGTDPLDALVFMIGIIVANVPEGLLATVTVSLALTAQKLSKKSVLVKALESVETLGSTSCICSDKTGTLTKNIMTVSDVCFDLKPYKVETTMSEQNFLDEEKPSFKTLVECGAICSSAAWNPNSQVECGADGKPVVGGRAVPFQRVVTFADGTSEKKIMWQVIGDASEAAMLKLAQTKEDVGVMRERLVRSAHGKLAFSSVTKCMAQVAWNGSNHVVYVKGAPEVILKKCDVVLENARQRGLTEEDILAVNAQQSSFAKDGKRVFGFAYKILDSTEYPKDYAFDAESVNFPVGANDDDFAARLIEATNAGNVSPNEKQTQKLCFIGLMALIDPPRAAVPAAVEKCKSAGIKVIMVTGDHPETAKAIAKEVGIIWGPTAVDVAEANKSLPLEKQSDPDLAEAIVVPGWDISIDTPEFVWDDLLLCHSQVVFARTTPQQKLLIVEHCQKRGHVVAVTGDGVNDSPALRKADIGVAMGIMGTEVSQEAADMILMDDNFASIVVGVEEGRIIFDNLKKSIAYTLSSNIPEIAPFLVFILAQVPLALTTILILLVDLGTDMIPAISIAWETAEADIMARNPRDKTKDRLVTAKLISFAYFQIGVIQAVSTFFVFFAVLYDYGFAPHVLPGLSSTFGTRPLYCELSYGGWRNHKGDICAVELVMTGDVLVDGVARDAAVKQCQRQGYFYWDAEYAYATTDLAGVITVDPPGEQGACEFPLRNLDLDGEEPSGFDQLDPSTYGSYYGGGAVSTAQSIAALTKAGFEERCATTECRYFYEYAPYASVRSPFFKSAWGAWPVGKSGVPGLGEGVPDKVFYGFQTIGTWVADVASAKPDSSNSAGHISAAVDISTSLANPARVEDVIYTAGYLDYSTNLPWISTNNLSNAYFGVDAMPAVGTPEFEEIARQQLQRCTNLQSIDDLEFSHNSVKCYVERDDEEILLNVASRQISRESLTHAQTASFVSIVVVQTADLVVCKTRYLSIYHQLMRNGVLSFALVFEVCLAALLCYALPVGYVLNTRPIRLTHWFLSAPFACLIVIFDESRKALMRSTSVATTDLNTGRTLRHAGFWERFCYY